MPANVVKKGQEKEWEDAKKQANKAVKDGKFEKDSDSYWAYTTKIFKNMIGESVKAGDVAVPNTPNKKKRMVKRAHVKVNEEDEDFLTILDDMEEY